MKPVQSECHPVSWGPSLSTSAGPGPCPNKVLPGGPHHSSFTGWLLLPESCSRAAPAHAHQSICTFFPPYSSLRHFVWHIPMATLPPLCCCLYGKTPFPFLHGHSCAGATHCCCQHECNPLSSPPPANVQALSHVAHCQCKCVHNCLRPSPLPCCHR